jgi:hypothetical protein
MNTPIPIADCRTNQLPIDATGANRHERRKSRRGAVLRKAERQPDWGSGCVYENIILEHGDNPQKLAQALRRIGALPRHIQHRPRRPVCPARRGVRFRRSPVQCTARSVLSAITEHPPVAGAVPVMAALPLADQVMARGRHLPAVRSLTGRYFGCALGSTSSRGAPMQNTPPSNGKSFKTAA